MALNSETGHSVNLSNFKLMIDYCTSYGSKYQPSNPDLALSKMTTQWEDASQSQQVLTDVSMNAKKPIADRKAAFAPLSMLVTKTVNYYGSTKGDKQLKKNVKTIADRIRGAGKVNKAANPKDVSVSHQGYVQRREAFAQLLGLYKSDTNYAPNEDELKMATLDNLDEQMKLMNDNIGTIIAPEKNALIKRDEDLYREGSGIVDVAAQVKDYVQGVFGSKAPETKAVNKLKFTRPKKK